jgi:hypothetical protein
MTNTFKPWLHPIEPETLAVLRLVNGLARNQQIPLMLLGAFARELHFIRGMKEHSAHPTYPLARERVKELLRGMQSVKG